MGNPSPKPRAESSRQYERLLRGKATPKQYVQTLKKEARSRVREQRAAKRGSAAA